MTVPCSIDNIWSEGIYYLCSQRVTVSKRCQSLTVIPWTPETTNRVSYRGRGGGGGGGGGWNFPPPPPRNLEIEFGYYCFVTGIKQQSCPRLQSERI